MRDNQDALIRGFQFEPRALAAVRRRGFPRLLAGAPVLLPTADTDLRRSLEQWFERLDLFA